MAVSGSGGWVPSNKVRMWEGRLKWVGGYTQNKPKYLIPSPEEAARRLLRGEAVTIDVRRPYQKELEDILHGRTEHQRKRGPEQHE